MKDITRYILEARNLEYPELPHQDGKTPERIAYDSSGNGWIVGAFCYADGGAPEGCNSLENLLKEYDTTGSMKEEIDNLDGDTIIVGAWPEEDDDKLEKDREYLAWVWGRTGICYENKKK